MQPSSRPLDISVESAVVLDAYRTTLKGCRGVAESVHSLRVTQRIIATSLTALELEVTNLLMMCSHLRYLEIKGVREEVLSALVQCLTRSQSALSVSAEQQFWSRIVQFCMNKSHLHLSTRSMTPRLLDIEFIGRNSALASSDPNQETRPSMLVRLTEAGKNPLAGILRTGSSQLELKAIVPHMWMLDGAEADRYWTTIIGDLRTTQLEHLTTLDVRASAAAVFTESLASLIKICPKLERLAVGARPLQHDTVTDPEVEEGLYAILMATPISLHALLVNCYGFSHGETMQGLTPLLKKVISAGALRYLRKLILEASAGLIDVPKLLDMESVPPFLRTQRISVISRLSRVPPLGIE
ncbi:hypothetical protein BKA62DRAFT_55985 [Auriculariales sp. MPI-PUGE-AT-0066]|nr:hypothetical protein BKA62DRAFT_55985 [Auriculariales sp. MPI-PUGE-AT-0066]